MKNNELKEGVPDGGREFKSPKAGLRVPLPSVMLGLGMLAAGGHLSAQAALVVTNDNYSVQGNTTLSGQNVVDNDFPSDHSNVVTSVLISPAHGVLNLNVLGGFSYVPTTGFSGSDSFTYQLQADGQLASAVVSIAVVEPPAPPPTPPVPPLPLPPQLNGLGTQPTVLDLASGQGPAMTSCLLTTVRALFGADAQYLGQGDNGVAKISLGGGRLISFYPMQASTNSNLSADIHLNGSNALNIGTSCGNFNLTPALSNLGDFGSVLNRMGLKADISSQGLITLTAGDKVYVARPEYLTSTGSPTTPNLSQGADGLYRFTDSAGHVQIFRPAFLDVDALSSQVQLALSLLGWAVIQIDGTALFTTLNGQQYVLTPDLTLTGAPAAHSADYWWQDGPNHYLYRSNLLTQGQGFTVQKR